MNYFKNKLPMHTFQTARGVELFWTFAQQIAKNILEVRSENILHEALSLLEEIF